MIELRKFINDAQYMKDSSIKCPSCGRHVEFIGSLSPEKCLCGKQFPDIMFLLGRNESQWLRTLFFVDEDRYFNEEHNLIHDNINFSGAWDPWRI